MRFLMSDERMRGTLRQRWALRADALVLRPKRSHPHVKLPLTMNALPNNADDENRRLTARPP